MRTCIGCRRARPAAELVRFAQVGGALEASRTAPGRGAWLCPGTACFDLAVRRRAFGRALRTDLSPDAIAASRPSLDHGTFVAPASDVRDSIEVRARAAAPSPRPPAARPHPADHRSPTPTN